MTVISAIRSLLSNAARTADARHMQQAWLAGSQPCSLMAISRLEMEVLWRNVVPKDKYLSNLQKLYTGVVARRTSEEHHVCYPWQCKPLRKRVPAAGFEYLLNNSENCRGSPAAT